MPNPANLSEILDRHTPGDGIHETEVPGLRLVRSSTVLEPNYVVQEPAWCVVVQGAKRVRLGDEAYVYDADRYLMVSFGLPLVGEVLDASPERPYLALAMTLEPTIVADLLLALPNAPPVSAGRGLAVGRLDETLREALARYVGLLDTPEHAAMMGPMLRREILYRLLVGPEGGRLRALAQESGGVGRVAQAIETIRRDYDRPLRIETLAREVGMSLSGLHHHFKAVTAMSPLQFQKRLRLHEARRLMLGDGLDAASAAFRVGYESPSQFSREYRRLFGAPPAQDAANQRAAGIAA